MKKYNLLKIVSITVICLFLLTFFIPISSIGYNESYKLAVTKGVISSEGFFGLFNDVSTTIQVFSNIGLFIIAIGVLYAVLSKSETYNNFVKKFASLFKSNKMIICVISIILFGILGAVVNDPLLLLVFMPFIVSVMKELEIDNKVILSSTVVASLIGGMCGIYNNTMFGILSLEVNTLLLVKVIVLVLSLAVLIFFTRYFVAAPSNEKKKSAKTGAKKAITKAEVKKTAEKVIKKVTKKEEKRVNKVIYAVLTILFGSIGVNKFYAGKIKSGIIRLVFCWTLVPAILSIVEFITVLTEKADNDGMISADSERKTNALFITSIILFVLFVICAIVPWETLFTKLNIFTKFNTWLSKLEIAKYPVFSNIIGAPAVADEATGSSTGIILALGNWTMSELTVLIYMLAAVIAVSLKEFTIKEGNKKLLIALIVGAVLSVIVTFTKVPGWLTTIILMATMVLLILFLLNKVKVNEVISTTTSGIKNALPIAITTTLVAIVFIITLGNGLRIGNGIGVTILNWILSLTKGFNMLTTTIMIAVGSVMAPVFDYFTNCAAIILSINVTDTNLYGLLGFLLSSIYYLLMIIAPTSIGLIAGLYYLDIPYNKWFKYIWKVLLALLLIVVVAAVIIYVRV